MEIVWNGFKTTKYIRCKSPPNFLVVWLSMCTEYNVSGLERKLVSKVKLFINTL